MSKRFDSRIEEAIARIPGLGWFDSRRSGDPVGYVHKVLWTLSAGAGARLARNPAWSGGAAYVVVYALFFKLPGTVKAWRKWRRGESQLGPLRDRREPRPPGIHFGFLVDAFFDLLTAVLVTLALAGKFNLNGG